MIDLEKKENGPTGVHSSRQVNIGKDISASTVFACVRIQSVDVIFYEGLIKFFRPKY